MNEEHLVILRVDSSMRHEGSVSRLLADEMIARLHSGLPDAETILRDLKAGVGHVNSAWREASLESAGSRSSEDRAILAQSDALKAEVERADIIVLAVPIYNFSIPAALKAWVDMVCRNNVDGATALSMPKPTYRKQAVVLLTSNHTLVGASDEFAAGFLQHILAFLGFSEIDIVDATGLADNKTGILASAHEKIQSICQNVTSQNISAAAE
ncbi:NAD(P)H-dependent oxidoreductase [Candidatus Puniceispirillum sp.]|nr:NAD(P)H-dependent oxidoreductase [Candidatus Puniceispirillum sp.]